MYTNQLVREQHSMIIDKNYHQNVSNYKNSNNNNPNNTNNRTTTTTQMHYNHNTGNLNKSNNTLTNNNNQQKLNCQPHFNQFVNNYEQQLQTGSNIKNYNNTDNIFNTPQINSINSHPKIKQQQQNFSTMKDMMISLQYRIRTLQTQVNTKMQRQECFSLLQRKANSQSVKMMVDEINSKFLLERENQQKRIYKLQQQQKRKFDQLRKRLNRNNNGQGNIHSNSIGGDNNNQNNNTNNDKVVNLRKQPQNMQLVTEQSRYMYSQHSNSTPFINVNSNAQGNNNNKNSLNAQKSNYLSLNSKHNPHSPAAILIKPQQLYLQSNETMFAMLIDEINQIKQNQTLIERLIETKHKKTIGLNNQVCRKLQSLQREIEQMVKWIDFVGAEVGVNFYEQYQNRFNGNDYCKGDNQSEGKQKLRNKKINNNNEKNNSFNNFNKKQYTEQQQPNFMSYHTASNQKKPLSSHSKKLISKSDKQPLSAQYRQPQIKPVNIHYEHPNNNIQSQSFQSIRLELVSKSLQTIQKQLSLKLNIKDLLPFIKQNIPNLEQPLQEMKLYIEENFQSMRKILENQSQINEELTKASKVAWFHCYEKYVVATSRGNTQRGITNQQQVGVLSQSVSSHQQLQEKNAEGQPLGYILFSQQLINLIPQHLQISKQSQYTIKVNSKGWYLIKVFVKQTKKDTWESKDEIEQVQAWVEVNSVARYPLMMGGYRLVNLSQSSIFRVITAEEDVFVEVRKL